MTFCVLSAIWLPSTQDWKSLMLHWWSFQSVVLWISAAIDKRRNNYTNAVIAFMSDWEAACWKSRAQKYSCMGHSHSTKNDTSVWILHFTNNRFLYEQISWCNCSVFSRNISLTEILDHTTYITWWKHIDSICPTFSCFPYSSLFHCTDGYQPCFSVFHWLPCCPNQPRNIRCSIYNMVICAFRSLDASAWR